MYGINFLGLAALAAFAVAPGATRTTPQINLSIWVAPDCPYGYFDYAPHNCAPDGYYGREWFRGGAFIGAGAWFSGPDDFQGLVDNTLDPQYGYHGPLPEVGEKRAAQRRATGLFNGNEVRDGQSDVRVEGLGGKT